MIITRCSGFLKNFSIECFYFFQLANFILRVTLRGNCSRNTRVIKHVFPQKIFILFNIVILTSRDKNRDSFLRAKEKKERKKDKTLKPGSNSTADYFHNQRRWFPFLSSTTESRNIQHFSVQSVVTQLCRDVNRHNELLSLVLGTFNFRVSDNFAFSTEGKKKERNEQNYPFQWKKTRSC